MKKLLYPLLASVLLSCIMPIGTFVVDPIDSFGFLVICLLFVFPICFAGIGLFCGTQTQYRTAWAVPLVCVLFWSATSYLSVQNTSILWYFLPYLGVSYATMILTALIAHCLRKRKQSDT